MSAYKYKAPTQKQNSCYRKLLSTVYLISGSFITACSVTVHNEEDLSHSPVHKLHESCKSLFVHEYELLYNVIQTILYCVNLHNDYSSNMQVRGNDHGIFDGSTLSTLPAGKIGLGENGCLRCPPNPIT